MKEQENIKWNDINKFRFYAVGTALYTAITVGLHPINVIKTRQQVLEKNSIIRADTLQEKFRLYYRGVGIVLVLAIPARSVYITTLELTKDTMTRIFGESPLVSSISGGLAGGLSAMSSQMLVVPMDIVSQKQMVMNDASYDKEGSSLSIIRSILKEEGLQGLYRGFGMSLFTSLPVGSLWWASYSGCKHLLQKFSVPFRQNHDSSSIRYYATKGTIQLISGLSAAIVAATFTQPLDVIKTRLQVGYCSNQDIHKNGERTYSQVAKELHNISGMRGFFRGLSPRIMSMTLWGTVLSSAYELLRHVSHKDFEFNIL